MKYFPFHIDTGKMPSSHLMVSYCGTIKHIRFRMYECIVMHLKSTVSKQSSSQKACSGNPQRKKHLGEVTYGKLIANYM